MTLAAGQRLGPYEIEGPVARGGMGEIYRARDTRLARAVALKVLPGGVSTELRERFEREARAIASLSHPHICALFDVGRDDDSDTSYLVMEYLEGETLRDRLARGRSRGGGEPAAGRPGSSSIVSASRGATPAGALPIDVALRFAIEIADALDRAHRQGIVHRDVKPSNVMLTKSGVKLLDFGLAKTSGPLLPAPPDGGSTERSALPTAPSLTGQGTILGTLNYMAPEQVEGKEADARTDIFALAAVAYEMLTGRRPFEGKSQASIIAAILEHEPEPISRLQPLVPPALDRVIRQCLAKDPDDRWQSAADVKRELEWIGESGSQAGIPAPLLAMRQRRARLTKAAIAAMGVALVAGAAAIALRPRPAPEVPRLHVAVPAPGLVGGTSFAVSPDGGRLAYIARDGGGTEQLWLRALDAPTATAVAGTDGARAPFFSPDSQQVAFGAGGQLKKVNASGGAVQALCALTGGLHTGTWGTAGTIVFAIHPGELRRVSDSGGVAEPIYAPLRRLFARPSFLPDGRHFVFVDSTWQQLDREVFLGDVDGAPPRRIAVGHSPAVVTPDGHFLLAVNGALHARRFDPRSLDLLARSVPIADGIDVSPRSNLGAVAASGNGVLVYRPYRSPHAQFVWRDRTGNVVGRVGEPGHHESFDLSPDGKRLVFAERNPRGLVSALWLADLDRGVTSLVQTGDRLDVNDPVFSPDGKRIAYTSRSGKPVIFAQSPQGGDEGVLVDIPDAVPVAEDWSRDGRWIAFNVYRPQGDRAQRGGIMALDGSRRVHVFGEGVREFDEPHFSPDARYVAYNAVESGEFQVYVSPVPPTGARWQISTTGGMQPRWRADGRELFFLDRTGRLMSVEVQTDGTFEAGAPRPLFETRAQISPYADTYAVTPAGDRFLINEETPAETPLLHVITGWPAALDDGKR